MSIVPVNRLDRCSAAATVLVLLLASHPAAQDLFPDRVYPAGAFPGSIAILQLDGDALPDVVVGGSPALVRLIGTGGAFEALPPIDVPGQVRHALAADLLADGHEDVVTLGWGDSTVRVFTSDGTGNLVAHDTASSGGSHPAGLAAGDFDEDGDLDIVTANEDDDTVGLLLNDGLGRLADAITFHVDNVAPEFTSQPKGLAVGDLDEDGHLDVVAAGTAFPSCLSLLLGDGAGSFAPAVNITMGATDFWGGHEVWVADVSGDGHVDLVTDVSVRLGDGTGDFSTLLPPIGSGFGELFVVDFDQDGRLDVLLSSSQLHVNLGDGLGGLSSTTTYVTGSLTSDAAAADLDLDGDLDVVALNKDVSASFGDIRALLNDGSDHFPPPAYVSYPTGAPGSFRMEAADFDDDGALDALVAGSSSSELSILLGDGAAGFLPASFLSAGAGQTRDLALGDIDADGDEDAAVLLDIGTVDRAALLVGDGDGGFTALPSLSLGGQGVGVALGDLNHDGFDDLLGLTNFPSTLVVRLGTGTGAFGAPSTIPLLVPCCNKGTPNHVRVADMDGDGHPDVLLAHTAQSFSILHGDGTGALGPLIAIDGLGEGRVVPADLDGDGDVDVVGRAGSDGFLTGVMLATGGGFGSPVYLHSIPAGSLPALGDVDGDGDPDLVVSHFPAHDFTVALNDGAGNFSVHGTFLAGGRAAGLVADLDGNGFGDFVASCAFTGSEADDHLSVVLNQTPSGWLGLAHALGGVAGAPKLGGKGPLLPSSPVTLSIDDGKPFGSGVLVIGSTALMAPFKGGTLVPFPLQLIFGLPLNGSGHFGATGTWFGGLPPGTSVYFQAWIADAAGPAGFAATNGLRATTP